MQKWRNPKVRNEPLPGFSRPAASCDDDDVRIWCCVRHCDECAAPRCWRLPAALAATKSFFTSKAYIESHHLTKKSIVLQRDTQNICHRRRFRVVRSQIVPPANQERCSRRCRKFWRNWVLNQMLLVFAWMKYKLCYRLHSRSIVFLDFQNHTYIFPH